MLERARDALTRATLDQTRAEVAAAELTVLRGTLDLANGNAERLLSELPPALALLPIDASHLRGLAHMGIAAAYWQRGDAGAAQRYLDSHLANASPQLPVYSVLLQAQGMLHWLNGSFTDLMAVARRLLSVSQELDLPDQLAFAHFYLGIGHLARNELDEAREHLETTIAARYSMRLLSWCHAVGTLAKVYQALGRPEDAVRTLNEGRDFLLERHAVRVLPNLGAFQAEIDLFQDRTADASAWAAQVEPGPLAWSLGTVEPRLVQARVFVSQGDPASLDRATALLTEIRDFCGKVPYRLLLMQVDMLSALIADRQGQRAAALETVEELILNAERDAWVRLFVVAGEPMQDLLRELAGRQVSSHTIARILKAFPPRSNTSASHSPERIDRTALGARARDPRAADGTRQQQRDCGDALYRSKHRQTTHPQHLPQARGQQSPGGRVAGYGARADFRITIGKATRPGPAIDEVRRHLPRALHPRGPVLALAAFFACYVNHQRFV